VDLAFRHLVIGMVTINDKVAAWGGSGRTRGAEHLEMELAWHDPTGVPGRVLRLLVVRAIREDLQRVVV
jgi:hypothetical protein